MASGKLAPHSNAGGSTANSERKKSTWKVIHGLGDSDGLIGQCGSDTASMNAVQAMPAASESWHHISATRGRTIPRASSAPALLPRPSPIRKTARMIENVYTDAPSMSERSRVHTTSAPSALIPDSAIATYTAVLPATCGAVAYSRVVV